MENTTTFVPVATTTSRVTVNLDVIWSYLNKDFSEITEEDHTEFVDQMLNHTELISKLPPTIGYAEKYRKISNKEFFCQLNSNKIIQEGNKYY